MIKLIRLTKILYYFDQVKLNRFDSLFISITLGLYFLILQGYEYSTVAFHINDSAFGSIFYMLTGSTDSMLLWDVFFWPFVIYEM